MSLAEDLIVEYLGSPRLLEASVSSLVSKINKVMKDSNSIDLNNFDLTTPAKKSISSHLADAEGSLKKALTAAKNDK